jgi:hypothetical protein
LSSVAREIDVDSVSIVSDPESETTDGKKEPFVAITAKREHLPLYDTVVVHVQNVTPDKPSWFQRFATWTRLSTNTQAPVLDLTWLGQAITGIIPVVST